MRALLVLGSLVLSVTSASCGSDAPPAAGPLDCGPVTPCGGDLEGTWRVRGLCTLDHACDGTKYDFTAVTTTLTFATSKVTTTGGGTARITLPTTCVADSGGTCMGLNSNPGYTCSELGASCSCTVDYDRVNPGIGVQGYLLSSNQLIINGQAYDYCVQNGVLRMQADLRAGAKGTVSEYVRQ